MVHWTGIVYILRERERIMQFFLLAFVRMIDGTYCVHESLLFLLMNLGIIYGAKIAAFLFNMYVHVGFPLKR